MELPTISDEQNDVITALLKYNVVVNSVAGSGKTTCNLYISKHYKNHSILLLTYNAKLKIETREKIKILNITNLEVHSYHSFCVKYYNNECYTDTDIKKVLLQNNKPLKEFKYNLILLDEAQDITNIYFELICKLIKDNINKQVKICIVGDENQSIYDFNGADNRYIKYASNIFNFNDIKWKHRKLSHSFRITKEMSDFINNCIMQKQHIISTKVSKNKPRYIICDSFGKKTNRTVKEIKYYLDLGYTPKDIFVLAPSIRNTSCPARVLENKVKIYLHIPVYVPTSDDEKIDDKILENKMIFSSYHQAKGLERKVVLLFGIDDSYFEFYKKNKLPTVCPNEIYVAMTRASERLSIFHHNFNNYIPFINVSKLKDYTDFEIVDYLYTKGKNNIVDIPTNITDITRHLSQELIDKCYNLLKITTVQEKTHLIDIPQKTEQTNGYENVSEITEMAINGKFQYKMISSMKMYDIVKQLQTNNKEKIIDLKTITPKDLLYIATQYAAYKSGYIFKTYQIENYNWLQQQSLDDCLDRLEELNLFNPKFDKTAYISNRKELANRKLIGQMDCIDGNNIYKFKYTTILTKEHYIQIALIMYINKMNQQENNIKISPDDEIIFKNNKNEEEFGIVKAIQKNLKICVINSYNKKIKIDQKNIANNLSFLIKDYKYFIFNILTNELVNIDANLEDLVNIVKDIIHYKYVNSYNTTDEEFLKNIQYIKNKY